METSGEAGVALLPAITSSSAAISEPSCWVMRCGRKNVSAARNKNGSPQSSSTLRRMTWTSWLMKMCGTLPAPRIMSR